MTSKERTVNRTTIRSSHLPHPLYDLLLPREGPRPYEMDQLRTQGVLKEYLWNGMLGSHTKRCVSLRSRCGISHRRVKVVTLESSRGDRSPDTSTGEVTPNLESDHFLSPGSLNKEITNESVGIPSPRRENNHDVKQNIDID